MFIKLIKLLFMRVIPVAVSKTGTTCIQLIQHYCMVILYPSHLSTLLSTIVVIYACIMISHYSTCVRYHGYDGVLYYGGQQPCNDKCTIHAQIAHQTEYGL